MGTILYAIEVSPHGGGALFACGGVTVTPAVCDVSVLSVPVKATPLNVSA
jgi:hypothetical protein